MGRSRAVDPVGQTVVSRRSLAAGGVSLLAGTAASPGHAQESTTSGQPFRVAFIYTGPVGDFGYTYAHDQGRLALEKALPNVATAFLENVPDSQAEAGRAIRGFCEEGFDLIVATSLGYGPAVLAVAPQFPDSQFIHISGFQTAGNVSTGFGKIEEPEFVAGAVAGRMAATGRIGFVASYPVPAVIRNINALTLGARSVNPDATVQIVWTNSWFDPPAESAAAQALVDLGVDVIAQYQDTPGPQQVAEAAGIYGIGVHVDMARFAPGAVLTGAVWNWGVYYIDAVTQILAGTWSANQYWGSWADGVVDLAPIAEFVPEDVRTEAETLAAEFRSGQRGIRDILTGPINRQDGSTGVPAGQAMSDAELIVMDWFVEGVVGSDGG